MTYYSQKRRGYGCFKISPFAVIQHVARVIQRQHSYLLSSANKCNQNLRLPGVCLHVNITAHFSSSQMSFT